MKPSLADFPNLRKPTGEWYTVNEWVDEVVKWYNGFEASLRSRLKYWERVNPRVNVNYVNTLKEILGDEQA